jgi:hypothetical protein
MTTTKMFNGLETTVLLYFLQLSNLLTGKSFHNRLAGSGPHTKDALTIFSELQLWCKQFHFIHSQIHSGDYFSEHTNSGNAQQRRRNQLNLKPHAISPSALGRSVFKQVRFTFIQAPSYYFRGSKFFFPREPFCFGTLVASLL